MKKVLFLLVAGLMIGLLTACGGIDYTQKGNGYIVNQEDYIAKEPVLAEGKELRETDADSTALHIVDSEFKLEYLERLMETYEADVKVVVTGEKLSTTSYCKELPDGRFNNRVTLTEFRVNDVLQDLGEEACNLKKGDVITITESYFFIEHDTWIERLSLYGSVPLHIMETGELNMVFLTYRNNGLVLSGVELNDVWRNEFTFLLDSTTLNLTCQADTEMLRGGDGKYGEYTTIYYEAIQKYIKNN